MACDPELAHRIYLLRDFYESVGSFLMDQYGVIAFQQLDRVRQRADAILAANRSLIDELLTAHADILECVVAPVGTTVAPRLMVGDSDAFCAVLRDRFETAVVPGRFFELPQHVRVGLGGDPIETREGLTRMDAALMEWKRR